MIRIYPNTTIEEVKEFIKKRRYNINAQTNRGGYTALMNASQYGHIDIVKLLIQKKADPNIHNRNRNNALELAYRDKNENSDEIARLLIEGKSDVYAEDMRLGNLLSVYYESLTDIDFQNIQSYTALMMACDANNIEIVQKLIQNKADVNIRTRNGNTALMFASNYDIIQTLIENKADVNNQNKNGDTALIERMKIFPSDENIQENEKVVRLLIDSNANVNVRNEQGETALLIAYVDNSWPEIARILINSKADVNIQDSYSSALHSACQNHDIESVKLLIENKADITAQNYEGKTAIELTADHNIKKLLAAAHRKLIVDELTREIYIGDDNIITNLIQFPTVGGHILLFQEIAEYLFS